MDETGARLEEMATGGTGVRETLSIICPSMGNHQDAVASWADTMSAPWMFDIDATKEGPEAGFLTKCQKGYGRQKGNASVLGFLHTDLIIHEHGWDERVLAEFEDPKVGVVGFVGAMSLGTDDLYKIPYHFTQLARSGVFSNLTDAEVHGERETGSKRVSVLDSCAIFVRTSLLDAVGGWPTSTYPDNPHCSDLWICCQCARLGLQVRMVGVGCTHRSGGKGSAGAEWLEQHGGDDAHHKAAHRLIYDQFRDVLPMRVK